MREHTHIQADKLGKRCKLPNLSNLMLNAATADFVCLPINIIPMDVKVLLMTEEQAANALNIPAEDLRHEREKRAINYRLANGNIRYTMNDLLEYVKRIRI